MLMYIQNLVKFCLWVLKILSGNKILTSIKGHNSVANFQKNDALQSQPQSKKEAWKEHYERLLNVDRLESGL